MWGVGSIEIPVGIYQVIPSSARSHVLEEETLTVLGGFFLLACFQVREFLVKRHVAGRNVHATVFTV